MLVASEVKPWPAASCIHFIGCLQITTSVLTFTPLNAEFMARLSQSCSLYNYAILDREAMVGVLVSTREYSVAETPSIRTACNYMQGQAGDTLLYSSHKSNLLETAMQE